MAARISSVVETEPGDEGAIVTLITTPDSSRWPDIEPLETSDPTVEDTRQTDQTRHHAICEYSPGRHRGFREGVRILVDVHPLVVDHRYDVDSSVAIMHGEGTDEHPSGHSRA